MVFVTVGSQKFQFNALLEAVDALVANGAVEGGAFAQTGACTYEPAFMEHSAFLGREGFQERLKACDIVITHGGTGAIIGAVKAGKKVIAVPRRAERGEHVDDHQAEIVSQFAEMGLIEPCMNPADVPAAYDRALAKEYLPYKSNTDRICADLAEQIDMLAGCR